MLQAAEEDCLEYIPWDFKYFAKLRGNQILEDMQPVIRKSLDATGMFVCPPSSPSPEAKRNTVSSWVRDLSRYSDKGAQKCNPLNIPRLVLIDKRMLRHMPSPRLVLIKERM